MMMTAASLLLLLLLVLAAAAAALKKLLNELKERDALNPANITSALIICAETTRGLV